MKRKSGKCNSKLEGILKKRPKIVTPEDELEKCFRRNLFAQKTKQTIAKRYASSSPYKHATIRPLIDDQLLRSVRTEILENIHFTLKETDIYKIYQSGDLANLDGLEDIALEKLPSLLKLRDALYSSNFRKYISTIIGCGDLSGRKTDMAINVYTPGCYLLCHDDVIGSRRVSYILYLTDPDHPWKEEWGGALRLFPTREIDEDGVKTIIPCTDSQESLPPAWNQLSFFAVQPGESFHDVEEVHYAATMKQFAEDGGRVRMAISGWFHIPQKGEKGYIEGEEESWGKNSSLKQLQGNPDRYDYPKSQPNLFRVFSNEDKEDGLSESDLDFLLKYISPNYLTPDTLESVAKQFIDLSCVTLDSLLSQKFSDRVREYIETQDKCKAFIDSVDTKKSSYKVAQPPHKHRFLYIQPQSSQLQKNSVSLENPVTEILEELLPSQEFRRWLELATDCKIESYDLLLRRFRRGLDYSLATKYNGKPQLEISLGLTPTLGWEENEELTDNKEENSKAVLTSDVKTEKEYVDELKEGRSSFQQMLKMGSKEPLSRDDFGGQEIYMAGDDDETDDAAVYKHSLDEEDDNILFIIPATWNKMSIVLRDPGTLKFVKYVSKGAQGDRWDISGTYSVKEEDENEINDSNERQDVRQSPDHSESSDEEFNGFSD
ncbi:Prolyl 3,4-dihydroxylase ofd1 [Erysiphe neolycopersici]|uniref:uS12 prolyl 3,4-dihydroxylase n=1 Tax=Erysiphe neolycopersici TaxID=212602 RepID=A0A420I045_9PEZI|nr:Prolyl 3,4-dihydroxylase ofd1 [Erysiphe neolycopersici]